MRILFVKDTLAWPRSAGHDVHGYHMMRALENQGHTVGLLTRVPVDSEAIDGLRLALCQTLETVAEAETNQPPLNLNYLQERYRSYWGVERAAIRAVGRVAEDFQADAVVAVGLDGPPYLAEVNKALRVWYAADESLWYHGSQVSIGRPATWTNLKQGLVNGLYERAFGQLLDRVWVVSEGDCRAMRWVSGVGRVDVVPNGVDTLHFAPRDIPSIPHSCVFWGRLDTGPNVQALEWFCHRVWPELRRRVPDAHFTIYGFKATPAVTALAGNGVAVVPDLSDLRAPISCHQVVVLPFVSGGGIKNKLLEAAGLAKAIVCTPRSCSGLRGREALPLVCRQRAHDWVVAIEELWSQDGRRQQLGIETRRWVETHHTWEAAAQLAVGELQKAREQRRKPGTGLPQKPGESAVGLAGARG